MSESLERHIDEQKVLLEGKPIELPFFNFDFSDPNHVATAVLRIEEQENGVLALGCGPGFRRWITEEKPVRIDGDMIAQGVWRRALVHAAVDVWLDSPVRPA